MTTIANTLGVGSGIDTKELIDALVAAERKPREDALTARSDKVTARISGMSQVTSALDALVAAMASRTRNGALGPLPATSDPSALAARATAGATRLLQPTSIEIKALAAGQSLVSTALSAPAATVGEGTITITLGTMTPDGQGDFAFAGAAAGIDIVIDSKNNSLTGLAAAINKSGTGVRASIIDDGQGARLVLKGPTGAKSAFIVTATGDPALDRFLYKPGTPTMVSAGSAHDASLVVDGVSVTRPTNTITDLVSGVSLDLVKAAPGVVVTLGANRDITGLTAAVNDLVDAVNALHSLTHTLTTGATDAGAAAPLAGDGTLRQVERQLLQLTATGTGGLAKLGVSTSRDGSLSVDPAKLSAALASDPDGAEALLAGLTGTGGALTRVRSTLGSSTDTRLAREQKAVAAGRTKLEAGMTTLRAQMVKQYAAMERAVGAFKATQAFLDEQIKAWNRSDN